MDLTMDILITGKTIIPKKTPQINFLLTFACSQTKGHSCTKSAALIVQQKQTILEHLLRFGEQKEVAWYQIRPVEQVFEYHS